MLLSTQTDRVFKICGEDKGLKIFADAGYEAIDMSLFDMEYDNCKLNHIDIIEYAKELRKKAEALGLIFNQAHAPFPCWKKDNDEYNKKIIPYVKNAIKLAGTLGAKAIVVHPIAYTVQGDAQKEVNYKMYRDLAPVARDYGIKIALENMWGYDKRRNYIIPNVCSYGKDLAEYYDDLNDPETFTVCLDLGHCGLIGEEPEEAIYALGHDRIGALHIHDNNYVSDTHTLPLELGSKMNWDKITKALGEIDYKGDFTYEADNFLLRYDESNIHLGVKYMAEIGRMLMAKIDAARPAK